MTLYAKSLQTPQEHVNQEVVGDYVTARHFVEVTVLSFPHLCVCVCVFTWGENRTVSAVSVSNRKVERGVEDEKEGDSKS